SSSSSDSSSNSDRKGPGGGATILIVILAAVLIVLAWVLSQFVRLALSRSREYLADAGSVELTKNPDAMISALRKIEGRGELPGATSAVMELCLDNPREGFSDLFATHPSVEARVQALVKYAGGHYVGPLALPMHPGDEQDRQTNQPESGEPPRLPLGPWSDAGGRSDTQGGSRASGPWGNTAGNSTGPWGPR
ncbi:MAG TPA: M48 family metalloprotease, partial [Bradyrhizobium sp.]|nr:M48 family metalloprotease [Bradyrhizobium sp.]